MATLNGRTPAASYTELLKLASSGGITTSYKQVEAGNGSTADVWIKDDTLKVGILEFENTPSTAASGTVNVLVNDSGIVKQASIGTFGRASRDPYYGLYEFTGSATMTVPSGAVWTSFGNMGFASGSVVSDYAPDSHFTNFAEVYRDSTAKFFLSGEGGTPFQVTIRFTVTPAAGHAADGGYVEIGMDWNNDGTPDDFLQTVYCPQGDTVDSYHVVTFRHYITNNITSNGFELFARTPSGGTSTVDMKNVKYLVEVLGKTA